MYAFEETDGKCAQLSATPGVTEAALRPSVDTWRPLAGVLRHLAWNCVRRCRVSRRRVPARWASRLYFVCIVFIGAFVIVSRRREASPCAQARALCSSPTVAQVNLFLAEITSCYMKVRMATLGVPSRRTAAPARQ